MTKAYVSKRNALIPLMSLTAVGAFLILHTAPKDFSYEIPLVDQIADPREALRIDANIAQNPPLPDDLDLSNEDHAGEETSGYPADVYAPEAHAFGFELIQQGRWDEAETILKDACESGDVTGCHILGEEYLRRNQGSQAEPILLRACYGDQLTACRILLDNETISLQTHKTAFDKLTRSCRDQDDAGACALIAESRWARTDLATIKYYLGLACSRGDERSCDRLGGS